MLDERDLQAVRGIAEEVTADVIMKLVPGIVAEITLKTIDERVPKIIARLVPGMIRQEIHGSEVMLLDEMERFDRRNERKFAEIRKDQKELKELYRMIKNEQDTISMMLVQLKDHEDRITELETDRIAVHEAVKIQKIKTPVVSSMNR